jgi:beta-glucuronidase
MRSLKTHLLEAFFALAVLFLKLLQRCLHLLRIRRGITLPPGDGASGRGFRVTQVDGMPVLWAGALPYPTYVDESSHTVHALSGAWKMRFDRSESGRAENWQGNTEFGPEWMDTEIPSTYNRFNGPFRGHQGITWFARTFVPDLDFSRDTFQRLCLEGVLSRCSIWINEQHVGEREGGYTPCYFDVTDCLLPGEDNVIVVCTDNRLTCTTMPPKTRPRHTHAWGIYGGIYRDVRIESVPRQYVFKVAANPVFAEGRTNLDVCLGLHHHERHDGYDLMLDLVDPDGHRICRKSTKRSEAAKTVSVHRWKLPLSEPRLWSMESPDLYSLQISLRTGDTAHEVTVKTGIRSIEVEGPRILLNGKSVFLKGIARHEDDPDLGASQSPETVNRDLGLIKEMGANYIRMAHYPHDIKELFWARDEGILLSEEIPYYSVGMGFTQWFEEGGRIGSFPWKHFGMSHLHDETLLLNAQLGLIEMVERDRNNPAVILWSVGNECYTLFDEAAKVFDWMRGVVTGFDPTRPVTMCEFTYDEKPFDDNRMAAKYMDVICVNAYFGWFYGEPADMREHLRRLHARFPDRPIIISEFGADAALGRTDEDGVWDPRGEGDAFAYGAYGKTHSEDYQVELYRAYWEIAREEEYVAGISPWIFSDFYHPSPWFERSLVSGYVLKGVVTREREPKRVYHELQRYYRQEKLEESRRK